MVFETFDFDPRIIAGIVNAGYKTPTPIQSQAIPSILGGRDLMGLAQTGTGKTAAFVLPILQRIMNGRRGIVRALIITPTRELAEQTHVSIRDLGLKTRLKSVSIYGGVGSAQQIQKLKSGVDIIVACPGRLLDHMRQGMVDLSSVEVLVLDEADRMLDMGFMPDVREILKHVPKKRQTLLFSATMPDDIRRLTRDIMKNPSVVQIDHEKPLNTISHSLYPVEQHLKTPLLMAMLRSRKMDSVLVFTRTKIRTQRLADQLRKSGFRATPLQGDMPQSKRQAALQGFKDGKFQILVATDIAARGVDVLGISHVINYDMPDNLDSYTHRIGRTGRAERTGEALTLVTSEDASVVRYFERDLGVEMHCREIEGFDYNCPAPAKHGFKRPKGRDGRVDRPGSKAAPKTARKKRSGARRSKDRRASA